MILLLLTWLCFVHGETGYLMKGGSGTQPRNEVGNGDGKLDTGVRELHRDIQKEGGENMTSCFLIFSFLDRPVIRY